MTTGFVSPLVRVHHADDPVNVNGLRGATAATWIPAGTVVAAFGGTCVPRAELDDHDVDVQRRALQIDEDLFLVSPDGDATTFVLHSCDPSCHVRGTSVLVSSRDLNAGEPITYDFATTHGADTDEFECGCGSVLCRGKVTGHDWMLPDLQLRYRGQFSPYLASRISGLEPVGAERRAFAF